MNKINFEETPFLPGFENNSGEEVLTAEPIKTVELPDKSNKDDGLDFNCEVCGDTEGGCPQCGFGRNKK